MVSLSWDRLSLRQSNSRSNQANSQVETVSKPLKTGRFREYTGQVCFPNFVRSCPDSSRTVRVFDHSPPSLFGPGLVLRGEIKLTTKFGGLRNGSCSCTLSRSRRISRNALGSPLAALLACCVSAASNLEIERLPPLDDHLLFEGFADENVDILGSFWSALWISGLALAKLSVPRGLSEADLIGIISHKPPPQTACLIGHVPRSCRCVAASAGSQCPRREDQARCRSRLFLFSPQRSGSYPTLRKSREIRPPGCVQSSSASATIDTGLIVGCSARRLPSSPCRDSVFTPGYCQTFVRLRPNFPSWTLFK